MAAKKSSGDSKQILELLTGIDARLTALEAHVQEVTQVAPDVIATVTDTFDGMAANWAEQGIDLDERLQALTQTIEVLSNPKSLKMLRTLLERSPELEPVLVAMIDAMASAQKSCTDSTKKCPVAHHGGKTDFCSTKKCPYSFLGIGTAIAFFFRFLRSLGQSLK